MPGNTKSKKPNTRCVVRDNAESGESNSVKRTRKRIESTNNKMDFVPKPRFISKLLEQTGIRVCRKCMLHWLLEKQFYPHRHTILRRVLDAVYCDRRYEISIFQAQ